MFQCRIPHMAIVVTWPRALIQSGHQQILNKLHITQSYHGLIVTQNNNTGVLSEVVAAPITYTVHFFQPHKSSKQLLD